jgi:uncharacterized protein (TIGR02246 family)
MIERPDAISPIMSGELEERIERLESRIHELEAIEGVRATILDYALAHDRGQSDAVADLFTEDARLDIAGYGPDLDTTIEGRDAIRAMYTTLDRNYDNNPPFKHMVTNCHVTIEGTEAVAITYLNDLGGPQTDTGPGGGLYQDRLRCEPDGRWRFAHKQIIAVSTQTVNEALAGGI